MALSANAHEGSAYDVNVLSLNFIFLTLKALQYFLITASKEVLGDCNSCCEGKLFVLS